MPPNWEEIKRCPIWKVLGVIECNNCDTAVQCWGEEMVLPEGKGYRRLLEAISDVSKKSKPKETKQMRELKEGARKVL